MIPSIIKPFIFWIKGRYRDIDNSHLAYCAVATMTVDGREIGLFESYSEVSDILGTAPEHNLVNERHQALKFAIWGKREIIALTENDRIVKLTSYRPGSRLVLQPARRSSTHQSQEVWVGMSEAELKALLEPAGGDEKLKAEVVRLLDRTSFGGGKKKPAKPESWLYYPTLNFGVLILDGLVAGITVTPAH